MDTKASKNEKLYQARLAAKYTQKELASNTEISERMYRAIEAGHRKPNVYTALKLAKALNEKVENLFDIP